MASYPTNLPWAGPHGLTARYTAGGAAASSSSAPGGAPPDGSLAELLDDFSSLLDAEWRVIIAAMLSMLAMVYAIVARLIVRRRRPPATLPPVPCMRFPTTRPRRPRRMERPSERSS